ncbi:MAG TPA: hypothetical protein VFS20_06495 [Longimicrobium sp.]|nr:hypothetical protein [Longimicrobium sp.]
MDHERVAALHDGRLAPRERDELLNELLADDDEFELFAETAAVLRELEKAHASKAPAADAVIPGEPPPPDTDAHDGVIPLASRRPPAAGMGPDPVAAPARDEGVIPLTPRKPGRTRWTAYGALAAGLVGLALTAALLTNRGSGRLDDPAGAIAMLEGGATGGPVPDWTQTWDVPRGEGTRGRVDQLTVRIGATLVDLELAYAAGDTALPKVERLSAQVDRILGDSAFTASRGIRSIYRDISNRAANGAGGIEPRLADGREELSDFLDPEWLELGVWAETARTAALRRDTGFFHSRDSRAALERIGTLPDINEQLTAVRQLLPEDGRIDWPANDERWTELEDRLANLLR